MRKVNRRMKKQPSRTAKRPGSGKFKRNRGSTLHLQHFDDIVTESYTPFDNDDLLLRPPSLSHLDLSDDDGNGLMDPTIDLPSPAPTSMPLVPEDDSSFYFDARPSDITFDNSIGDSSKDVKDPPIKTKKQRNKAQKARQIIPGDDIYISSDDDVPPSDDETIMYISQIDEDDDPLRASFNSIDIGAVYSDEAAIDRDFIENTDPETWQQLQQWATQRSVVESDIMDRSAAGETAEVAPTSSSIQTNSPSRTIDFGLCDSDDDEYIRNDNGKRDMSKIVRNTMVNVPPSLHAGMKAYMQHDRQQKKLVARHAQKDNTSLAGQLQRVNRRIRLFFLDPSRHTYQFPAMSKFCRGQIRDLANLYGIQVTPQDLGCKKIGPLLTKPLQPGHIAVKTRLVQRHITRANDTWISENKLQEQRRRQRRHQSDMIPLARPRRLTKSTRLTNASKSTNATKSANTFKTIPVELGAVGSEARPLESSNLGHKMLAKMGWKVGDSLGANNNGIIDPIQAVVRQKNRGLGA